MKGYHLFAILAGTYEEAESCAQKRNIPRPDWFFLNNPESLSGTLNLTVIRTGSWKQRKDLEDMTRMISDSKCQIVDDEETDA